MVRAVLMSLKPRFAAAAYSTAKRYEYRRCSACIGSNDLVLVYESSPVQMVTGYFVVGGVKKGVDADPTSLETDPSLHLEVLQYLKDATAVTALEILNPRRFASQVPLSVFTGLRRPPQSYLFLEGKPDELLRDLEER